MEELEEMYAEQVSVYGVSVSKEQAISNKRKFFKKYSNFVQSITGHIEPYRIKENQYKLVFPKRTNYNNKTIDVEGYLIFEKISGVWKIINESDDLTDKNISNKPSEAKKSKTKKKFITCLEVVETILKTSPRFKELTKGLLEAVIKNGGTSIGSALEGSPNPKKDDAYDYSENYNFNLHETYPDRETIITRFLFDPIKKQLYEYDLINDNFKLIDFDRALLIEFTKLCN